MTYKDYIIRPSSFFPSRVEYCPKEGGEIRHAYDIDDAKDQIDEKIMNEVPPWKVETIIMKDSFKLKNITKFTWLEDAVSFANRFSGRLTVNFLNP
jgi:hypothetical protein